MRRPHASIAKHAAATRSALAAFMYNLYLARAPTPYTHAPSNPRTLDPRTLATVHHTLEMVMAKAYKARALVHTPERSGAPFPQRLLNRTNNTID
eukprot:scaffold1504_cov111-Isochrysis_galbana.AAC.9